MRYWAHRAIMKTWTTSVDKTMKTLRMIASVKQLGELSWQHEDSKYWTHPYLVCQCRYEEHFYQRAHIAEANRHILLREAG